ncbi:MAG TPA: hypothetical protein VLJ18_03995 [Thermoanaerobaculia bacterium]|nr:hypothetical protein [Thermoanaerobaculia bacterium]
MQRRRSILMPLIASTLLSATNLARAADPKPIETYTAFAASLGTGRTAIVDLTVTRWSSDKERDELLATLQEFGRDRLVKALEKLPPVGTIRTSNSIGYDLYFAREHKAADGSRRVILATNRPVSFRELMNNTRSKDYQFTLIELRLGPDGKGEGKLVPAAKVTWDKDEKRIEIENYSALPVELLQVTAKKP